MACTIVTSEAAVFALWGKPRNVDIDDVFNRVQAAARTAGRPVVFVARIRVVERHGLLSAPAPAD